MKLLSLLSISLGAYLENVTKKKRERKRKDEKWHRLLYNKRELHWQDFRVWGLHKKSYPFSQTLTLSGDTVVVSVTYLFSLAYSQDTDVLKDINSHTHVYRHSTICILILLSSLRIFYLSAQESKRRCDAIIDVCNLTYSKFNMQTK